MLFFLILFVFLYSNNVVLASDVCEARTASELKSCFTQLNLGVKNVVINGMIDYSGQSAGLSIVNQTGIVIEGKAGIISGILRKNGYNFGLLSISNSQNILIKNLVFNEGNTVDYLCGTVNPATEPNCNSVLTVSNNSSNVVIDSLSISGAKWLAVAISTVGKVSVINSKFIDNKAISIWGSAQPMIIEKNYFLNTRSNALLINPIGSVMSTIRYNVFDNNHNGTIFHVCGANGTGPCSGGQIFLKKDSQNVIVSGNRIINGKITEVANLGVSGIELETSTKGVTISNNIIENNSGVGIISNSVNSADNSTLVIESNELVNNLLGNISVPGAIVRNNCNTLECGLIGNFESVSCNLFSGSIGTSLPMDIHFYADGIGSSHFVGITKANIVKNPYFTEFNYSVPNTLKDGKSHVIDAYLIDNKTNPKLWGSGKTITCSPLALTPTKIPTILPTITKVPTLTPSLIPTSVKIIGDADNSGSVDLVDFTIWKNEYLTNVGLKSDFNDSKSVDLVDFTIWKNIYLSL